MLEFTKEDIHDYVHVRTYSNLNEHARLTEEQIIELLKHCNHYIIEPNINAWFDNLDDYLLHYKKFRNFSKEESLHFLERHANMFCKFNNGEIVRLMY